MQIDIYNYIYIHPIIIVLDIIDIMFISYPSNPSGISFCKDPNSSRAGSVGDTGTGRAARLGWIFSQYLV